MTLLPHTETPNGLNQSERILPALHPSSFRLDEHSKSQLIRQTIGLASSINYFNFDDRKDGNWESFFDTNIDMLINLISELDLHVYVRDYEKTKTTMKFTESVDELLGSLTRLVYICTDALWLLLKFDARLHASHSIRPGVSDMHAIVRDLETEKELFVDTISFFYAFSNIKFPESIEVVVFGLIERHEQTMSEKAKSQLTALIHRDRTESSASQDIEKAHSDARATVHQVDELFLKLRKKLSLLINAVNQYRTASAGLSSYDPHLGLFQAFLQLFEYAQRSANGINERHLRHYYETILGIKPNPGREDMAHVLFELAPGVRSYALPAGTKLLAGDNSGFVKHYILQRDLTVTKAAVRQLRTSFLKELPTNVPDDQGRLIEGERQFYAGIYPAPTPAQFLKQGGTRPWPILGEDQSIISDDERNMLEPELGLMIGSPALWLPDGKREIVLRFAISRASAGKMQQFAKGVYGHRDEDEASPDIETQRRTAFLEELLRQSFLISLTTGSGWLPVGDYTVDQKLSYDEPFFSLTFSLRPEDEAVVNYDPLIHGPDYAIEAPAVKLLINHNAFYNPLGLLKDVLPDRINIQANVTGSKQVLLRNNLGPLVNTIPFQPFGAAPVVGNYFDIVSPAIFNRFTQSFTVNVEWQDLPRDPGGFTTYFKAYENDVTNDSFQVSLSALSTDRVNFMQRPDSRQPLFETWRGDDQQLYLSNFSSFESDRKGTIWFSNELTPLKGTSIDADCREGIRIQLQSPQDAFGHKLYPQIFPAILARNAKWYTRRLDLPNLPYTPTVSRISVDYTVIHSESLLINIHPEDDVMQLVHLHHAGYRAAYPAPDRQIRLIPELEEGSNLYIGLDGLAHGEVLTLLFQLEEKSFPNTILELGDLEWFYLRENRWQPLEPKRILSDKTLQFKRTGTITLALPTDLTEEPGNSIYDPSLYWVRASVRRGTNAQSRVQAIFAQAGVAIRNLELSDSDLASPLPPNSISGFPDKVPMVQSVLQPFSGLPGMLPETDEAYWTRVAERLRHKDRMVTVRDISQMVLQRFPELLMVRCFQNMKELNRDLPDINLHVVVLPKINDSHQEPRVSLARLLSVKSFIEERASPFMKLEVGNPVYERVKVVCKVWMEANDADIGLYLNRLNEDLRRFINPWMHDSSSEIIIGGRIYLSQILSFIQQRSYVRSVTGVSLLHFYQRYDLNLSRNISGVNDTSVQRVPFVNASRPDAILFSADNHWIEVYKGDYAPSESSGISELTIGQELPITLPPPQSTEPQLPALSYGAGAQNAEVLHFFFNE